MDYFFLKIIHIISATLMIGTGLGSAFYLYFTYKNSSPETIKDVLKLVIKADTIFTTPSVLVQLITGILLSNQMNLTFTYWFWVVCSVSLVILVLWVRAALIQLKLRKILERDEYISDEFHQKMKIWFYLGIPSFLGSIYIYYLMVYKPFVSL